MGSLVLQYIQSIIQPNSGTKRVVTSCCPLSVVLSWFLTTFNSFLLIHLHSSKSSTSRTRSSSSHYCIISNSKLKDPFLTKMVAKSSKGRPQFVLFGSSIVQMSFNPGGWGAILADLYSRKADVLVRGYNGWNTRMALQVLDHVFPKDAQIQPSLVILYFGGNDSMSPHPSGLGAHVPLTEYVENMRKMILHIKGLSDKTRIICFTSPPVHEAKVLEFFGEMFGEHQSRTNEACRKYSEALIELCQELGVESINLFTKIQERDNWANACLHFDGIHLSAEGSKVVMKEILKILKRVDWEPSLYWLSMVSEYPEDSPYYIVCPDGKTTFNPTDHVCSWQKEWVDI